MTLSWGGAACRRFRSDGASRSTPRTPPGPGARGPACGAGNACQSARPSADPAPFQCARPVVSSVHAPPPAPRPLPRPLSPRRQLLPACVTRHAPPLRGLTCRSQDPLTCGTASGRPRRRGALTDTSDALRAPRPGQTAPGRSVGLPTAGGAASGHSPSPPCAHRASGVHFGLLPASQAPSWGSPVGPRLKGWHLWVVALPAEWGSGGQRAHLPHEGPGAATDTQLWRWKHLGPRPGQRREMAALHLWLGQAVPAEPRRRGTGLQRWEGQPAPSASPSAAASPCLSLSPLCPLPSPLPLVAPLPGKMPLVVLSVSPSAPSPHSPAWPAPHHSTRQPPLMSPVTPCH